MNRDDIIRMAHECGLCSEDGRDSDSVIIAKHLEQFANLVAAAERERIKWDTIHSCHPECDKPVCVAIRAAVAAEREREWQGLTMEETELLIREAAKFRKGYINADFLNFAKLVAEVGQLLKEKNV